MGLHRAKLGRRGMVALAATGALIVGGGAAAAIGTGSAAPLVPAPVPVVGTTYVEPDLAPFAPGDIRGDATAEVSDAFGAPEGGGVAALRLQTPGGSDKAALAVREEPPSPLAAWIPTAAYSAYRSAADNPVQFPSMQLAIDFDPTSDAGFSTLTYEPVYNPDDSTTPEEWHRYEAGAGNWCSTRAIPDVIEADQTACSNGGAKPFSAYVAGQPDIVVTALVLNQGTGNPGLDAAVDLVSTPSTTYDFELVAPEVPGEEPCEEPTVPSIPMPHPGDGEDEGHENGGHENQGHHDKGGHDKGGHDKGGHENGGHDGGHDGGHEPRPEPEPCSGN
ncbi:DUF4779 domain-containing protein [Actinomycetospora cinnamomea]|uniref:Uncharacterized protein n=1 Tax=Actinomycetospora cinnamomea TaxID=663609 RepID=A0A2U1FI75_9PSEU|nr:DUF4779 domain-containing protein [Actinomycetospora cinnamomea]PVZ11868.1 hypothetical protein C8D89_103198 [Actinomycetospora cinnamomea]